MDRVIIELIKSDANNISNSMIVTYPRLGLTLNIATPKCYNFSTDILDYARDYSNMQFFNDPHSALENADFIVTDTWVSMGQESEKLQRLQIFNGWQVTEELAKPARKNWKFLHCLPRKQEEVDDDVFYGSRSLVFQEAVKI